MAQPATVPAEYLMSCCGSTGLLVYPVKKKALENGKDYDLFRIDDPPGTGCPLISMISVDVVLIVTEPCVSGLPDLERVAAVPHQFGSRILIANHHFYLDDSTTDPIRQ